MNINIKLPAELEEKIAFYENCLDDMKLREERIKALKLSEYIRTVRAVLREDGCTEEYIQLKGNGNATEIEFFIISSSSGILKFIKDIQKEPENLFDIKQIKIRNSEDRNRIQTTVCFDVKVKLDSDKNEILVMPYFKVFDDVLNLDTSRDCKEDIP